MTYTSSLISKYGDTDNVTKDAAAIKEIIARQGTDQVFVFIAEYVGTVAVKYKLSRSNRELLIKSLPDDLKEALQGRL